MLLYTFQTLFNWFAVFHIYSNNKFKESSVTHIWLYLIAIRCIYFICFRFEFISLEILLCLMWFHNNGWREPGKCTDQLVSLIYSTLLAYSNIIFREYICWIYFKWFFWDSNQIWYIYLIKSNKFLYLEFYFACVVHNIINISNNN